MSLYYHLGSAGAGKTTGVQERIVKEASEDRNRSFLFIVPEQFTLQTQRDILNLSASGGMLNIDALSFARLAHRVFEELGITLPQVLEDTGKSMIVKKMLLEHQDELTIYKGKVKKQGFAEEMKSLIAEFYQYGIDTGRFADMKDYAGNRAILKAKLHDIEVIYQAFAKFIEGRFVMNEEVLDRMCEVAGESELIKNSVVVLDGFTGFTPSQYNCIDKLMKYAKDIHVVLTIDEKATHGRPANKSDSLFELSLKTIEKLEKLASANDIPSGYVYYDGKNGRFKNTPSLNHLEQNIFRYPYRKSNDHAGVTLLSAAYTEEEADFIVSRILEFVFEKNMRFQDIAVLSGDPATYSPVLERKLLKAGIPYFIDQKRSIVGLSAVEFIDSAIDIILSDFSYDNVFRFLKTGLTGMEHDSVSRAENFVIEHGIKGYRRWSREWKAKDTEPEVENKIRAELCSLIDEFRKSEEKKEKPTVTERLTLLYSLLKKNDVELKLYNLSENLKESVSPKDRIKGMELGQCFKLIVTVFERINSLLGEERMPLNEFKEVLDTGFNEAKLRAIPGGTDSIVVGDMERTRIDNKKILFFAGCNDGVIPGNKSKGSLLNEFERELFAENDIELSPTMKDNANLSEFYMYLALTRSSEKVYLSYSKKTGDDKEARPAYIFGKLMRLYEGLEVQKISDYEPDNIYGILGSDNGISALTDYLRTGCAKDSDKASIKHVLYNVFRERAPELLEKLQKASKAKRITAILSDSEAEQLYGKIIIGSITRLQQFAECAFSHFAKYGLKLQERKEFRIGGMELGSIYHDALKIYASGLKTDNIRWADCTGENRLLREEKAIETALANYQDVVNSSRRYEYIQKSLKRVFSRTVDIVSKQICAGKFDVEYIEKGFSHESSKMKLTGIIDRVDVVKKNGKTYFRIIDYKTGKTSFDIEKVKAGLQLQLAIYTAEAASTLFEKGDDPIPAGMYYYKIDDPLIEVKEGIKKNPDGGSDATGPDSPVESEIMKKLRLDGLTVGENEIIALHDTSLISEDGKRLPGSSEVIPYDCKKDGDLTKSSEKTVVDTDTFNQIGRAASEKAKNLAEDILHGNVAVNPYEYKQENACSYCPYAPVCKFDRRLGDSFRSIT